MINQQNMKVKNGSTWHTICPFPVGFIYLAATSTSPGTTFGGTWVALTSGHFLRPAGTFSGTGGESSHTLTVGEMPSHQHTLSNLLLRDSGTYSGGRHRTDWGSNATKAETTASAGGGQLTTICRLIKTYLDGDEPHSRFCSGPSTVTSGIAQPRQRVGGVR